MYPGRAGTRVTNGKITLGDLLAQFLTVQARRVEAHEIKRRTYEASPTTCRRRTPPAAQRRHSILPAQEHGDLETPTRHRSSATHTGQRGHHHRRVDNCNTETPASARWPTGQ